MILTIPQAADIWTRNGGAMAARVVAVAVAMAESSLDTLAHSPSDDWGIWQINSVHFGENGLTAANATDPDVNAQAAIRLSSNGTNWAQWATCYADIGASGWLGFLSGPQPGSAADRYIPQVIEALAASGGSTAPGLPTMCQPGDIGIPAGLVAGLQPGHFVQVRTCDGGPFDAGDLQPGLAVSWTDGSGQHVVFSANKGVMVPANTLVTVERLQVVPGSGGIPGPSPAPSPTPTPPPASLPPPVTPLPVGPPPTGTGRESAQIGYDTVTHWLNYGAPDRLDRIANARTALGDALL